MAQFRQPLPGNRAPSIRQTTSTSLRLNFNAVRGRTHGLDGAAETHGTMDDNTVREVVAPRLEAAAGAATPGNIPADAFGSERLLSTGAAMIFGRGQRGDGSTFPMGLSAKGVRAESTVTVRARAEERQRLVIAELNHRMRNTLAKMGMIVELSRASACSVDSFADAVCGRINALAHTYARTSGNSRARARLRELVEDELAPYRSQTNVRVEGREVPLSPEPAQALALVLHELVTNAVKYGALSTADGRVRVRWKVRGELGSAQLNLVWQEEGGPSVATPKRQGFGTRLIHHMVHHELGGRVELSPLPTGLRCEMQVPLACIGGK